MSKWSKFWKKTSNYFTNIFKDIEQDINYFDQGIEDLTKDIVQPFFKKGKPANDQKRPKT